MSQQRLAVYTDFAYRSFEGRITAQLPFALFINALADNDIEVTVVGRCDDGNAPFPFTLDSRIAFYGLPNYATLASVRAVARVSIGTVFRYAAATRDANIVWLFGPHPWAFTFAVISEFRRQRVVLGVRQDLPSLISYRRRSSRWLRTSALLLERGFRGLARRYDTVVVGSELERSYRRARHLLNLPISLVARAQIADAEAVASRSYAHELVVISVGRLDPEKNPLLLADTLNELRSRDPRWRLEVYGQGSLKDALADRLKELGLTDNARLCGYVPIDRGLLEVYRRSHALLHVSWTEGVPQVIFEAFAAGLPVVATAVGGVSDCVGNAGILVAPGDPVAPAAGLARIGSDARLRTEIVAAGLERVSELTLEAQAAKAVAFVTGR